MKLNLNTDKLKQILTESQTTDSAPSDKIKLNLSKLTGASPNNNDSAPKSISFNKDKLKTLLKENIEQQEPAVANNPNLTFRENDSLKEAGFKLTFTEGEEYNLDDIIYAKRRNNSNSPLIVKVLDKDHNDQQIIQLITELILSDYGIEYNKIQTDENAEDYYKNKVNLVPNFYNIFDTYFNRLYPIYYNQKHSIEEGSIQLSDSISAIQKVYEQYYTSLSGNDVNAPATLPFKMAIKNKPNISYEYGTLPDEEYNPDIGGGGNADYDKFDIEIIDNQIQLMYDNEPIENAKIAISDIINKAILADLLPFKIDVVDRDFDFTEDFFGLDNVEYKNHTINVENCPEFSVVE